MINSYPLWKYCFVFFIFILGCVYVLPSLYKENFVVVITDNSIINNNNKNDDLLLNNIHKILKNEKLINKFISCDTEKIQIYFVSEIDQLCAYEALTSALSKQYLVSYKKASSIPNWLHLIQAKPIKLGLDLQGGLYLMVKMDIETVLNRFQEQYVDALKSILNENSISYIKICNMKNYEIEIDFQNIIDRNHAILCLSKIYKNDILIIKNLNKSKLRVAFAKKYISSMYEDIVKKNITIFRNRIYQLNISDPIIHRYGDDSVIIELPGIQDINKIKSILNTNDSIELRLVNTNINKFVINNNNIPADSEIKLDNNGNIVPLYKRSILTGNHIINSNISFDKYHRPQVNIFLDSLGSSILSQFTKDNIGELIATLFIKYKDTGKKNAKGYPILYKTETVINIATVQSQLSYNFCISGINDINEARNLSSLLRMGSLASPIFIEEEFIIGPTLGKKNIVQGIVVCGLGVLISICFMIIWYRCFGCIAGIALIMNLILIISIMSLMPGLMLTMSSIAGIVLTLSVAIDSNVLINERIKEEIKQGKPVQYSIYTGYRKAFITILDANITTIITSIILYIMSTGPIQGFAITTIIGVGTSMFTSIVGTRTFVNLFYGKRYIIKLSI